MGEVLLAGCTPACGYGINAKRFGPTGRAETRGILMLTIHDRYSRRAFLQIGSLGGGGLSLTGLRAAAGAAAEAKRLVTDKSVIFLFLHGGPSQTETFDPKM